MLCIPPNPVLRTARSDPIQTGLAEAQHAVANRKHGRAPSGTLIHGARRFLGPLVVTAIACVPARAANPTGNVPAPRLIAQIDEILLGPSPPAGRDNDGGTFAWNDSYAMMACVEMLEATGRRAYADRLIIHADQVLAARDDVLGRRDLYRDRVVPAWSNGRNRDRKRYAAAVHTGMIAYPMARFSVVLRQNPELRDAYAKPAQRLLRAAAESVAVHDEQFRDGPAEGEGYIYGIRLRKVLPLNQQNALARAWIALDEARDEDRYAARIAKLGRFFKNRLRHDRADDLYTWEYWPELDAPGRRPDDISHAAINVDFAAMCFARRIVFDDADHRRFCNTFTKRVLPSPDRVAGRVDGSAGRKNHRTVVRWGRLAVTDDLARSRLLAFVARRTDLTSVSHALGLAYLVHVAESP